MPIVAVKDLSKSFGAQDVFSGINVQLDQGERIALVGPNGAGKSTLLRIIAGLERPSAGTVTAVRTLRIGYLPQQPPPPNGRTLYASMLANFDELRAQQKRLAQLEQGMSHAPVDEETLGKYGQLQQEFELAGGYTYEYDIRRILTGVGFRAEEFDMPLDILSGGQRTRAHLAELLLSKPDLLLLDEPTNHLDLHATEWLESYLIEREGGLVVVAHDRYFLDRVAEKVWDMEFGSIEVYKGNYSRYAEQKAERLERRQAEYDRQQALITATEAFIRRYHAGQRAKEARGRLKKLNHIARIDRPKEQETLRLDLKSSGRSGDLVLQTTELVIGFRNSITPAYHGAPAGANTRLFTCPELVLRRTEKTALIGPNGSGKTSFLRTILGQVPPLSGSIRLGASVKIGYFSQTHDDLNPTSSALDEILAVKNIPISQARNYLARFLFSGDDVFKPLAQMSGGERSRVALAKLTLAGANFLVLDEPTNHLDIASREILEEVFLSFDGTILFVSHDRYLIDALATQIWALDNHRLYIYRGGYSDYLEQRQLEEQGQQQTRSIEKAQERAVGGRIAARRQQQFLRKQLEEAERLENQIAALEARLHELSDQLNAASCEQRVEDVRTFGIEYDRLETEREVLLAQWVQMSTVEM